MDADQVRAYVAAKRPEAMKSPLAVACATFAAADEMSRAVEFAQLQARASEADSSVRKMPQQQSYKELKLSLQRLDKQIHLFQYTKIRETHLFLVNNKLLVNENVLASRLESLMEEVRNVIYLPNYDFDMVVDNLSVAKSIIEDLCGPLNLDE